MVSHTTFECVDKEPIPIVNGKEVPPFGLWLRASGFHRGYHYETQKGVLGSPTLINGSSRSGKALEKAVPESTSEGESSQSIIVLVKDPSEFQKQNAMDGQVGSLKLDIVMSQAQGSISEGIVTQSRIWWDTKWERSMAEGTEPFDKNESGVQAVAQQSIINCNDPVSFVGPSLETGISLCGRPIDLCESGHKSKIAVDSSTRVGKRKSGRGLKLGITGEKFKVSGGKRKFELMGKGDSFRGKKLRKTGIIGGVHLVSAQHSLVSSSLDVTKPMVSPVEVVSDSLAGRFLSVRRSQ
ncbi:hypothetical protein QYF36_014913 [Acer negundo]|nr:hypothetical protein QYF36_014913 [Acer negundo]